MIRKSGVSLMTVMGRLGSGSRVSFFSWNFSGKIANVSWAESVKLGFISVFCMRTPPFRMPRTMWERLSFVPIIASNSLEFAKKRSSRFPLCSKDEVVSNISFWKKSRGFWRTVRIVDSENMDTYHIPTALIFF